jgi:hypothetical protein
LLRMAGLLICMPAMVSVPWASVAGPLGVSCAMDDVAKKASATKDNDAILFIAIVLLTHLSLLVLRD